MTLLRRRLKAEFRSLLSQHLRGNATADAVEELARRLVAAVPVARIDPLDQGLFFYHGVVDESDLVDAEYEILSAHMNLPGERRIEITLSTATFSIFAATALIALISSMRANRRSVRVHCVGWVSAAALAVVQSADERTIEPTAFIVTPPASRIVADGEGMSPDTVAYGLFLKHYVERGASMPPFWEHYPASGLYLTASEALAHDLFDAITPVLRF